MWGGCLRVLMTVAQSSGMTIVSLFNVCYHRLIQYRRCACTLIVLFCRSKICQVKRKNRYKFKQIWLYWSSQQPITSNISFSLVSGTWRIAIYILSSFIFRSYIIYIHENHSSLIIMIYYLERNHQNTSGKCILIGSTQLITTVFL